MDGVKATEVVAALIWDNDKFLICQRPANKSCELLWEFVGGKVEPGETKEQALIRECQEELGITLSVGDVFMDVIHDYPDITIHLTLFNASIAKGIPQKLEHIDIRWINTEEISLYKFCPADKEILQKIKNIYDMANKSDEFLGPTNYDKIQLVGKFGEIIDKCRCTISALSIKEECTFQYAVIRLYSKMLLTMCEIYTLLKEGYPEGALSLSRSTYECIVVLDYINKNQCDEALIQRIFDSAKLSALELDQKTLEWVAANKPDDKEAQDMLNQIECKLNEFRENYPDFCDKKGRFSDYWWAGKGTNFSVLTQKTDFKKNYMYKITSNKIHSNYFNSLFYIDNSEEGILIGETNKGIELPIWFSSLNLCVAVDIINSIFTNEENIIIINQLKELIENVSKQKFSTK